jgi:hypothetical protein
LTYLYIWVILDMNSVHNSCLPKQWLGGSLRSLPRHALRKSPCPYHLRGCTHHI